ncbi:MAG: hypothetical protein ACOH1R_02180 [Luteimonas sp.]
MPGTSRSIAKNVCVLLCALGAAALLPACGGKPDAGSPSHQVDALPKPEPGSGSITGMSGKHGPGEVPLSGQAPPQAMPAQEDMVDLLNPETGILPGSAMPATNGGPALPAGEPSARDAVAVIADYYASVDNRSYARAYALWSDDGRASKQTPQQFADGFAQTAHVEATIGTPGNEDAGAGQRYVQVPVTINATRIDGSTHRYAGQYTLHRTVVDGATAQQRAWRIASADLREVTP